MTDQAYRNAVKRRNDLLKEIKEVEIFLEMYRRFSGTKVDETETQESLSPLTGMYAQPDAVEPAPLRKKRRGNPEVIADAAERIIRESGHPMVRSAIAEALEMGGIEIPSGDKARYLGTVLWRQSDRFINLDNQGYWLKGVPNKEAGYDPDFDERFEEEHEKRLQSYGDDAEAEGLV